MEKTMLDHVEEIMEKQEVKNIEISKKEHTVSKHNVKELQAELDRLNYSWQKGRIKSVEEYDRKYDALVAQIEEATREKQEEPTDLSHIKETLSKGWETVYAALDNDHKKAFWRSFVKEIHIDWRKEHKEIMDVVFF
jgi:tRNA nucleotidyltransferase/poly(A) polymerase